MVYLDCLLIPEYAIMKNRILNNARVSDSGDAAGGLRGPWKDSGLFIFERHKRDRDYWRNWVFAALGFERKKVDRLRAPN